MVYNEYVKACEALGVEVPVDVVLQAQSDATIISASASVIILFIFASTPSVKAFRMIYYITKTSTCQ